jgi:creatinine amidohydrolase
MPDSGLELSSLHLERLTWPEVERALADGYLTVVVPCGAVEQHGPHLPLFMDAEHGTRLGEEVTRRLGNALLAPTIRVGVSEHHMAFPGTLSLEPATFVAICRDYCRSLSRHGFTKVCMLPTHGGNFQPLAGALTELNEAVASGCVVRAYTDFMGLFAVWQSAVAAAGGPAEHVGGHADIAESSLMLLMHPELVKEEEATAGYQPDGSREEFERLIGAGFRRATPTGILGDARGMSRAIGRRCLDDLADAVARYFQLPE